MRGFLLDSRRKLLRAELRRGAAIAQHHAYALDAEELLDLVANSGDSARGNVVRRALLLSALAARNFTVEQLAEAYKTTPEQITAWRNFPLLDDTGLAAAIDVEVAKQLVETPEPGRYVPVASKR